MQNRTMPTIGKAVVSDAESILDVAKLLYNTPKDPNRGFLLGYSALEEYQSDCVEGNIYVAKLGDRLIGFIGCHPIDHPRVIEETKHLPDVKWNEGVIIQKDRILYLSSFGVHPEFQGKGIGRTLEEYILSKFPEKDFLGAIVEAPVPNSRSARFHERLGFQRVGEFRASEAFGMKNYQSGIYLRKASKI